MSAYWHPVPIHAAVCPAGLQFRALLGQKLAHAYLVNLWGWCHQYRPKRTFTGDLRAITVADAAGWARSPAKFIDALVAAGWADDDGTTLTLREPRDVAEGKFAERAQGAAVDTSRQSKRQRDAKYKAKVKAAKKATAPATPGDASPATPSDAQATPPATTPATTPEPVKVPRAYSAGASTHETDTENHIDERVEDPSPVAPAPAPRLELVPEPPAKPPKTKAPRWTDPCPINPAGHRVIRETENRHTCQCGAWMNPGAELVLKAYEEAFVKPPGHIWTPGENVALANAKQRWSYVEIAGLMRKLAFDPFNRKQKLVALLQPDKLETVAGAMTGSTRVDNDALAFRGEVKL